MNKENVYLEDYEEKLLPNREDLQKYLDFRKEHDRWAKPYVKECQVVGIDTLTSKEECNKSAGINIDDTTYTSTLQNETHLLLIFPDMFEQTLRTVRYTAFPDICARAGLFGRTMELSEDKGEIAALPSITKGMFFTTGFSLNGEECNILIRDEKISSMKSKKYQIFPEWKMITVLEEHLADVFPDYTYLDGKVSHEFLSISYELNSKDMEESFKLMLENIGNKTIEDIKCGIIFSTSDVGSSSVSVAPYVTVDGLKLRLGNRVYVRHDVGNSIDDFSTVLESIAASFQEAENRVEELGNIDIQFPKDCFTNIVESNKTLPKTEAKLIADDLDLLYPNGCTAIDVYLALTRLVEKKTNSSSIAQIISLQETVARMLWTIEFTEFDKKID